MKGVSGAWSNQGFGYPSLDSFHPVLQRVGSSMLCTIFGGEISNKFAIGDFRDLPHTYSCTWLYSNTKVETRDSASFECQGV